MISKTSSVVLMCVLVLGLASAGVSSLRVSRQTLGGVVGGVSDFPVADAEKLLSKTFVVISGEEKDTVFK